MAGLALRPPRPPRPARRVAMTPLIDITFILLLFFILETHFSELRALWLPVAAPEAAAPAPGEALRPLRIEVFDDGRLWAGGRTLEASALGDFLASGAWPSATPVVIATASRVPLQTLVGVCDALQRAGLQRIDIRALDAAGTP